MVRVGTKSSILGWNWRAMLSAPVSCACGTSSIVQVAGLRRCTSATNQLTSDTPPSTLWWRRSPTADRHEMRWHGGDPCRWNARPGGTHARMSATSSSSVSGPTVITHWVVSGWLSRCSLSRLVLASTASTVWNPAWRAPSVHPPMPQKSSTTSGLRRCCSVAPVGLNRMRVRRGAAIPRALVSVRCTRAESLRTNGLGTLRRFGPLRGARIVGRLG